MRRLLECACFCFLNHVFVSRDINFNSTVLCTTFGSFVSSDVVCHRQTFGREARSSNAGVEEVCANGFGTLGRYALVNVELTGVVGEAEYLYVGVGVRFERSGEVGKACFSFVVEGGTVCGEEDTAFECYFDSLVAVNVGCRFDSSLVSELFFELFFLFIHLVADEHAYACANSSTSSSTDSGTFACTFTCSFADESADTCANCTAATCADKSTFTGICNATRAFAKEYGGAQDCNAKSFNCFHFL